MTYLKYTKYLVWFLACSPLIGCSANLQHTDLQSNGSETQTEPTDKIFRTTNIDQKSMLQKNMNQSSSHQTIKQSVLLDVAIIKQKPELKNGCEVTSLAMVLQYAGIKVNKMELAEKVAKDNDPIVRNSNGDIIHWGNPNHGFVGDITGKSKGYSVYEKPAEQLMKQYLPDRTLNLTGKPFDAVIEQLRNEKPVMVWTTSHFKAPVTWDSWNHGEEKINATFELHSVVLVGFDHDFVYVNDPLTGVKGQKVNRLSFIESWEALGKQALSYN